MNQLSLRTMRPSNVLIAVVDFLLFNAALTASFFLRAAPARNLTVYLVFAPLFVLWMAAFYALELYELRVVRDFVALTRAVFGAALACGVFGAVYFYLLSSFIQESPKTILLLILATSHAGAWVWRRAWLLALDVHLLHQRLIFLGDDSQVRAIKAALNNFLPESDFVPMTWEAPGFDMVVADLPWVEEHWGAARVVLSHAVAHRVPVIGVDVFYEALTGKVSPLGAARPAWAIEHVLPRAGSSYPHVKRLIDVAASTLLLILFAPLLLAIYVLIVFVDRQPPLYPQPRVGFLGREFILWKFRTMRVDPANETPFLTEKNSSRRGTRLGMFLRRLHFDELPQLWNVLRGDLSLVGPRPEWTKEVEVLEKLVPNYHLRHLVPAGITGWAQVYYPATSDPQESVEKHHYDLYYLKYFSFALDVSILLKTVKRIFVRDAQALPASIDSPRAETLPKIDVGSIISRNS